MFLGRRSFLFAEACSSGHDDGEVPARTTGVSPVGEEAVRLVVRTAAGVLDLRYARGAKLAHDDGGQIHVRPRSRAVDHAPIAAGRGQERGDHLLAHLEARAANVRAEGAPQLSRARAKRDQPMHHLGSQRGRDATPATVHGGDEAGARSREQERDAVGGTDADGDAGLPRDDRVRFLTPHGLRVLAGADEANAVAVHLAHLEEAFVADGRREAAVILGDGGGLVAQVPGQVQRREGAGADAAAPGGEAVTNAGGVKGWSPQEHAASLTGARRRARRARLAPASARAIRRP